MICDELQAAVLCDSEYTNKSNLEERYAEHYRSLSLLDKQRRLRYLVQEGRKPLCQFLDSPVPDRAFARENDSIHLLELGRQSSRKEFKRHPDTARYRSKRVKDARNEAQKEIEEYRKQKDDEFKKFEEKHTSGNKKAEEDAERDVDEQVKAIRKAGDEKGEQVVKDLLRVVTDVRPEVPDRVVAPPNA
ncbi:MAG: hypothetical protein Q9217_000017 [Psora testacea]